MKGINKHFLPKTIVAQLDIEVVGQSEAKKLLATEAFKRYISGYTKKENIILSGDSGVGKSLLVRALAKVTHCPFVDIDITSYSETGYVGNKVDQIAALIAHEVAESVGEKHEILYELDVVNATEAFVSHFFPEASKRQKEVIEAMVMAGRLDNFYVPADPAFKKLAKANGQLIITNRIVVSFAKTMFAEGGDPNSDAMADAIRERSREAIVLIDEIDKLCEDDNGRGHSVSRTGVQRSLLALVQGKKYVVEIREDGEKKPVAIDTTPILFVGAGAFQMEGTSRMNLIPELRGRFTKIAGLERLSNDEYRRIIYEPAGSPLRAYTEMLARVGVTLDVKEDAIDLMSKWIANLNEDDYVGARRVNGVFSSVMDAILFDVEKYGAEIVVDKDLVENSIDYDSLADSGVESLEDFQA